MSTMALLGIVALLSVIQSLVGVGLLVFGTPTLLLLGYSYADTLAALLPPSLTISLLQTLNGPVPNARFRRDFAIHGLLPLAVALGAVLALDLHASLNLVAAIALAVFVLFRLSSRHRHRASAWVVDHRTGWLTVMGVVHGLSNLGGSLLMILAGSMHEEKEQVRGTVAFCYAFFAVVQLAVLAIARPDAFGLRQAALALTAGIVFLAFGQRAFRWVSTPAFNQLVTTFATAYSTLLWLRWAGLL